MARMYSVLLTLPHYPTGDIAISSAEFILVSPSLYTLLTLTDLSRKVFKRVKFNFVCRPQLCCQISLIPCDLVLGNCL